MSFKRMAITCIAVLALSLAPGRLPGQVCFQQLTLEFDVHESIVAGDFNGDGHTDLAEGSSLDNKVRVLLGDGMGGFAAPIDSPAGTGPADLVTGDFDEDGNLDLAVSSHPGITVVVGDGNGSLSTQLL